MVPQLSLSHKCSRHEVTYAQLVRAPSRFPTLHVLIVIIQWTNTQKEQHRRTGRLKISFKVSLDQVAA